MGFYAVDPISGSYVFGTPLFDKVTIDLGQDRQFVVEADRSAPSDIYIQGIELNGS
jgi:putative alpha-1,2-mannosidase